MAVVIKITIIIIITWWCLQGDPMYNAYDRDIAVVNIFFGESTVFGERKQNKIWNNYIKSIKFFLSSSEFERSKKMTWFDFFSSIGGICGLCLGMSAISIVEFIYWFTVRLGENFRDWKVRNINILLGVLATLAVVNIVDWIYKFICPHLQTNMSILLNILVQIDNCNSSNWQMYLSKWRNKNI